MRMRILAPVSRLTRPRRVDFVLAAILAAGAILRIWQYAASGSLWLDEIMLSRSIVGLRLPTLITVPLPYNQLAPKGFLIAEKLSIMTFGGSDAALRLFPLAASIAGLFVFAHVARRFLTGWGPPVAAGMFASAIPLIHFGSLVKQYSSDVLVTLVFLWMGFEMSRGVTSRRAWVFAGIGAVLVWLSQPAVLVAAGIAAALVLARPAGQGISMKNLMTVSLPWILSAAFATLAARAAVTPESGGMLREYWAEGFPPTSMAAFRATVWPLDRLEFLFGTGRQGSLCYPMPLLYIALTAAGFIALWKQDRRSGLLLVAPVIIALAAAVARQYPFSNRLILYLVPTFLIAIAAAVEWIRVRLSMRWPPAGAVAMALLAAPTVVPVLTDPPPYRLEDTRPVLAYLQSKREKNDAIYVYYGAMHAVTYYGSQYGLVPTDYAVGRYHRGNNRCYLEDIDTFRGQRRLWIVIAHPYLETRERDDILGYLDSIGVKRDSFSVPSRAPGRNPPAAEIFLYDLSNSGRSSVTPASFKAAGPSADSTDCVSGGSRMMSPREVKPRSPSAP
jgi:hypothetical protein